MTHKTLNLLCGLCLLLAACQNMNEASNRAADATKRSYEDSRDHWHKVWSFNSDRPKEQQPQTRYCYQTQTDVVCYDSPQMHMTSKLNGYQDGANISAFQPGGGSLGVSGGEATANYSSNGVQIAPPQRSNLQAHTVDANAPLLVPATPAAMPSGSPFYSGSSPYVKGAVAARDLPPPAAR